MLHLNSAESSNHPPLIVFSPTHPRERGGEAEASQKIGESKQENIKGERETESVTNFKRRSAVVPFCLRKIVNSKM